MTGRERLAAAADALKARHGALLAGEPPVRQPDADRLWCALDAAQARAADRRRGSEQLAFDLRDP